MFRRAPTTPVLRWRRLLLLPAAALFVIGGPALATDQPTQREPHDEVVSLASPDEVAQPGWAKEADVSPNLVGITWDGDPDATFTIERRGGGNELKPVGTIERQDELPDPDSAEGRHAAAVQAARHASEPLWIGHADSVVVRLESGSATNIRLSAVDAPAASVPGGSAGALGTLLGTPPDRYGYAVAVLVLAVGLTALGLGWSPWRLRRRTLLAIGSVAGAVALLAGCVPPPPPPPPPAPPPTTAPTGGALPPQPAMILRSQWGADLPWNPSPDCAPGPIIAPALKFAVVHHTVNGNTYTPAQSQQIVRAIWSYHVNTLGYCDIAYNFLVDRYGQVFEGRMGGIDKAVVAAHTGGFNTGSTGMAWIGDWTSEQPPAAAYDAMVNLLAWKLSVHRVSPLAGFTTTSGGGGSRWPAGTVVSFPSTILGHRDLWPTACPGDAFYPRLGELRTAVGAKVSWPT